MKKTISVNDFIDCIERNLNAFYNEATIDCFNICKGNLDKLMDMIFSVSDDRRYCLDLLKQIRECMLDKKESFTIQK